MTRQRFAAIALILALALGALGCQKSSEPEPAQPAGPARTQAGPAAETPSRDQVVATTDEGPITRDMIAWFLEFHPRADSFGLSGPEVYNKPVEALRAPAEALALTRVGLVNLQASDSDVDTTETLQNNDDLRRQLLSRILFQLVIEPRVGIPDEAEVRAYYDENEVAYTTPFTFSMRHIFVSNYVPVEVAEGDTLEGLAERVSGDPANVGLILVDNDAKSPRAPGWAHGDTSIKPLEPGEQLLVPAGLEVKAENRERIEQALERVRGGEDFETVATAVSEAGLKGELIAGLPHTGRPMLKEIIDAAQSTPVGEVSGIFETKHGFNLIKIEDKQDRQTRPFGVVRDELAQRLRNINLGEAAGAYIGDLFSSPSLEVDSEVWKSPDTPTDQVVVRVGERSFTPDQLRIPLLGDPTPSMSDADFTDLLKANRLVRDALIELDAHNRGLDESPQYRMNVLGAIESERVKRFVDKTRRQEAEVEIEITEDENRAWYDANQTQLKLDPTYTYFLLAIDARPSDEITADEARAQALERIAGLIANVPDVESFQSVVAEHSEDERTREENRGLIEAAPARVIAPDLLAVLNAAAPNQMTQPVSVGPYVVVAWVLEKTDARVPSFEEAREQLPDLMRREREAQARGQGLSPETTQAWLADAGFKMAE